MRLLKPAVLLLVVTSACATATTAGSAAQRQGATLLVENQSSSQMTVYALRSGAERIRLGDAWSLRTTTLRIPPTLAQGIGLQFIADPIGSNRAPVSQEITVWPGDTIQMVIPPGN